MLGFQGSSQHVVEVWNPATRHFVDTGSHPFMDGGSHGHQVRLCATRPTIERRREAEDQYCSTSQVINVQGPESHSEKPTPYSRSSPSSLNGRSR